jgi:hypothetical protein
MVGVEEVVHASMIFHVPTTLPPQAATLPQLLVLLLPLLLHPLAARHAASPIHALTLTTDS